MIDSKEIANEHSARKARSTGTVLEALLNIDARCFYVCFGSEIGGFKEVDK